MPGPGWRRAAEPDRNATRASGRAACASRFRRRPSGGRRWVAPQANVSAISASYHWFICLKLPLFHPADAAAEAATGTITRATGSYWKTAVSHDAWVRVIVE